tara:strand:+ start:73290 stop:74459 length:1170 start_codon:yes stop_codon:yes gene_type:complete
MKPDLKPRNPLFSSGPCSKRPGWTPDALAGALVGRSHRAKEPKSRINAVLSKTSELLNLPEGYRVAIVPGSDTGAMEMAMWSLLGSRGADFFSWENFGEQWVIDGESQLNPLDSRVIRAPYGQLPDLSLADDKRDSIFVWNGTTSGVRVPSGDWISNNRKGVTICDATSAVFAYSMPWDKLDATTWSWQKVMGGEAGFGMIVLSPHAIEQLNSYTAPWPIPKIFRLQKNGKFDESAFKGNTINTVSLLAIEDALDSLRWIEDNGGEKAMIDRCNKNFSIVEDWVESREWVDFLAQNKETRSRTSMCLSINASWFSDLEVEEKWSVVEEICSILESERVAFDINTHRAAPPGIRIWGGATIESSDIEALLPWLDWAWEQVDSRHTRKKDD